MNKRKWLKLTTGVIGLVMALVMVLSVVSLLSEESTDPIASSIKKLALFVAEKLSTIENVISTSTHFVLKKYNNSKYDT